jgi:hypothetical protein
MDDLNAVFSSDGSEFFSTVEPPSRGIPCFSDVPNFAQDPGIQSYDAGSTG